MHQSNYFKCNSISMQLFASIKNFNCKCADFFALMVCCCAPMRVYMKANCWYKHQHVNCTLPLVWKNVSLGGLLYSFSCSFLSIATDHQWANQWHLVWSVLLGQSFWQYGMLSRWSILKFNTLFTAASTDSASWFCLGKPQRRHTWRLCHSNLSHRQSE